MESPPGSGWSGKHAVELYVRTYTTMLQSSGDIKIESLVQAHLGMGSVLHPLAASPQSDMGALLYAVRRLPAAISRCRHVIMGQSPQGFRAVLHADILSWQAVKAPARRRRWYHDGKNTLAVLIASASDIDDLVPTLVAYQIEWNKLHRALLDVEFSDDQARQAAGATEDDGRRLQEAGGDRLERSSPPTPRAEKGRRAKPEHSRASRHNWRYSGARQVFDQHPDRTRMRKRRSEMEAANGVRHIPAKGTGVDSAAQVFMLSKLDPKAIDPRVGTVDERRLRESDACILNVDYPLGQAAYHILRQRAE